MEWEKEKDNDTLLLTVNNGNRTISVHDSDALQPNFFEVCILVFVFP